LSLMGIKRPNGAEVEMTAKWVTIYSMSHGIFVPFQVMTQGSFPLEQGLSGKDQGSKERPTSYLGVSGVIVRSPLP
jgi:hypothetical protein